MTRLFRSTFAVALLVASCGGGGGDSAADTDSGGANTSEVAAESSSDFCQVVVSIGSPSASSTGTSEDVVGGVLAVIDGYIQFRNVIEDLADAAPSELDDEFDEVRRMFSEFPDVSSPTQALAAALWSGLNVGIAMQRIDDYSVSECGQTLFAFDITTAEQVTTPFVDDDGYTVLDATNLFGERHCESRGNIVAATSPLHVVLECVGESTIDYIGVDLDAYEVSWRWTQPASVACTGTCVSEFRDPEALRLVNASAQRLMSVYVEIIEATGFEPERRRLHATSIDLSTGEQVHDAVIPTPPELSDTDELDIDPVHLSPSGVGVVAAGKSGDVRGRRLYILSAAGEMLWDTPVTFSQYGIGERLVFDNSDRASDVVYRLGEGTDVHDILGYPPGAEYPQLHYVAKGPCRHEILFGISRDLYGRNRAGDDFLLYDQVNERVATFDLDQFSDASYPEPMVVGGGVLFEVGDKYVFLGSEGTVWELSKDVASRPETRGERLFMKNDSGALLEVDLATGQAKSTSVAALPPSGFSMEGGLMVLDGLRFRFIEDADNCAL